MPKDPQELVKEYNASRAGKNRTLKDRQIAGGEPADLQNEDLANIAGAIDDKNTAAQFDEVYGPGMAAYIGKRLRTHQNQAALRGRNIPFEDMAAAIYGSEYYGESPDPEAGPQFSAKHGRAELERLEDLTNELAEYVAKYGKRVKPDPEQKARMKNLLKSPDVTIDPKALDRMNIDRARKGLPLLDNSGREI